MISLKECDRWLIDMRIDIKQLDNGYVVQDEFGFVNQEFPDYESAEKFLKEKFKNGTVKRVIWYVHRED